MQTIISRYQNTDVSSVLRNTYALLSLTLVWSAITAYMGSQTAMGAWTYIGVVIGGFVTLFATFALRNSALGLIGITAFAGLEGFALGPLLRHYMNMPSGPAIIMTAAGMAAAMFIILSGYVLVTRKNFEFLGGMLFMALIGLILVSILGMFFHIPGMQLALALAGVLVFSGYILYDTSAIIHGGETNYIIATIQLYLDILNLFVNLLQLVGIGSSDD
jgi:modulator of FtsH protease